MLAVEGGHSAVAELLIDHGANMHAVDKVIQCHSCNQLFGFWRFVFWHG